MRLISRTYNGFTLAELLIALGVIGLIATFVIPKIMSSSIDNKNKAICKETSALISQAYEKWKIDNMPSATKPTFEDLMGLVNNLGIDTSTTIDSAYSGNPYSCSDSVSICYKLQSGAMIIANKGSRFGNTTNNNAIMFIVDPDGVTSSNKSVGFTLRYNGKLTTYQNSNGIEATSDSGTGIFNPIIPDPNWFDWK